MLKTSALKLFIVANLHYQPSWFVSSVGRMLHRHRKGHGFKSLTGLNFFFRPYFHFCTSSVHYCEDCLYIHIFICSSNIWLSYIYSRLLSTQLIIPNYLVILSHWCSTIVSLEVYPCFLMAFTAWINCVGENNDVFCYSPFPPKKMFYFYIWLADKVAQVG